MNLLERKNRLPVRAARNTQRQQVCDLLVAAGLPTEDVTAEMLEHFIVVELDGALRGIVGLEPYGTLALLRSLAVDSVWRSQGIAARLLERAERHAQGLGVTQLFTLTATAQQYLEKHGYVLIDRSLAPDEIREHAQFRWLCPDRAVCLCKSLERAQ